MKKLSEPQMGTLMALASLDGGATCTFLSMWNINRIRHYPNQMQTLYALERKGLVARDGRKPHSVATGSSTTVTWTPLWVITDAGREALRTGRTT